MSVPSLSVDAGRRAAGVCCVALVAALALLSAAAPTPAQSLSPAAEASPSPEAADDPAALGAPGPAGALARVEQLLEQRLFSEALAEIDALLAVDADDPAVLTLLARDDLPVAVPRWPADDEGSLEALLAYAARSPVSLQELLVLQLQRWPLAAQRRAQGALTAALTRREPLLRRFAALALRRLFPGFSVDPLTRRALLDPVEAVRDQAALALRDSADEALVDPLARALASGSSRLRARAAQSLGLSGYAAAVEPLALRLSTLKPGGRPGQVAPRGTIFVGRQISYVQDFDPEVATRATIADPIIGTVQEGATLDVKVFGASGGGVSYAQETRRLRTALSRLTGLQLSDTNAVWKRWWKTEGPAWVRAHRDEPVSVAGDERRS